MAHVYEAGSDHAGSTGLWSQVSGIGTATFVTPGSPTSVVNVSLYGSYVLRWTETNGSCAARTYDVTIDFNEDPSGATAATAQNICGSKSATLNAVAHVYEAGSDHAGSTGLWSQVSGIGTATFVTPGSPSSVVNVSLYGSYVLRWTETNGSCAARTYDVTIDFNEDPSGATAATAQNICGSKSATLDAVAHVYEAGSDHSGSTGLWSQVSGIGTATFVTPGSPSSVVNVSLYGSYVLRWTETNGSCAARTYDVTIDFNEDPSGATAATAQNICGSKSATLDAVAHVYEAGSDHAGSTGLWSQVSGIGTATFVTPGSPSSVVNVSLYGSYVLRWTETNGSCAARTYDVTIDFNEDPSGATAATAQNICGSKSATLDAVAHVYEAGSDHAGSTGLWSQVSGIGTATFVTPGSPSSVVNVSLYGSYVLRWTETNGSCAARTYDVTIDFNEDPSGATAATAQNICGSKSATLDAVAHVYEAGSDHAGSTGLWSQVSGIGTATFVTPGSPSSVVNVSLYGSYVLRWTETNGSCAARTYDVTIDFNEDPSGATAATAQNICGSKSATLNAVAHVYEAGSDHAGSTGLWSQVSGIGTATFVTPGSPSSVVNVSLYGSYVLRWTETNGSCAARTYDVTIDFNEDPSGATAATAQNICGSKSATLDAVAHVYEAGSDHAGSTGLWSQVSGIGTATFVTPGSPSSVVNVSLYGSYVLRWTETNGSCAARTYDVTIDFNEDPDGAAAGADQSVCGSLTTILTGTAHNYQAGSEHNGSTRLWTQVSGPGTIIFTDDASPITSITADVYGTYILRWTETNGNCSRSDDVEINFVETANAGNNQEICEIFNTTLTGNTPSAGTGIWSVVSQPVGSNPVFGDDTNPASTFTVDMYGVYVLRWTLSTPVGFGCNTYDDVEIWFDPKPAVTAVNDTICNNTSTNIIPQSTTSPVRYGIRYTWTAEDVDNIINGEANSTDNGYPLGQAIVQQLNNPDNAAHRVIYHITPWTVRSDNSLHCEGDVIDIDIWIEPTPRLSVSPSDTIVCDSSTVSFDVSDLNGFTAGGKFYYLTTTYDPLTVSGVEADGEKPAATDFSDQLINLTNEVQSVQYHFKARIKDPGINCESGTDTTITIYVNPTPKLSVSIADTIVCDSTTINIDGHGSQRQCTSEHYKGLPAYDHEPGRNYRSTAYGRIPCRHGYHGPAYQPDERSADGNVSLQGEDQGRQGGTHRELLRPGRRHYADGICTAHG